MKKQKKNCAASYLRKDTNSWKWIAGAAAAGVTASQTSATTITLVNNYISATDGDHLNADLTGDGHPDLIITGAYFLHTNRTNVFGYTSSYKSVRASFNGVGAFAYFQHGYYNGHVERARLGSQSGYSSVTGSIPVFFKDLHINGGAPTRGSLEVSVGASGAGIQLDSLTYNGPVQRSRLRLAVPDQGSSLSLLALGAGGVAAFRRRVVQGRC